MHLAQGAQQMQCSHLAGVVFLSLGDRKVDGGVALGSRTHRIRHLVGDGFPVEKGRVDALFKFLRIDAPGGQDRGRSAGGIAQHSQHQMVRRNLRTAGSHRLFAGERKNVAKILGKLHNYCRKSSENIG